MNKLHKKYIALFSILFLLVILNNTQAQTKFEQKPINSGVVNGAAISLPKPEYPIIGKNRMRPSGTVKVQVLIDESGNVITAKTLSSVADINLRKAAEEAALKAKFKPTMLSGKPVKVSGVIVYNFIAEEANEEKVKVFGLSLYLYIFKNSAANFDHAKKFFETNNTDEIINDTIAEFPKFSVEIKSLEKLEKFPVQERISKIDETISAVKNKLNASELWQFEVGKNFSQLIYQFIVVSNGVDVDISKFNENEFKMALLKIKNLSQSAPENFPKDVLAKLSDLAELGNKDNLLTRENFRIIMQKLEVLFETISPGSTSNDDLN